MVNAGFIKEKPGILQLENSRLSLSVSKKSGDITGLKSLLTGTEFLSSGGSSSIALDAEVEDNENVRFRRADSQSLEGLPSIIQTVSKKNLFHSGKTNLHYLNKKNGGIVLFMTSSNNIFQITREYCLPAGSDWIHIKLFIKNITEQDITLNEVEYGLEKVRIGEEWTDEYLLPTMGNSIVYTNDYVKNLRDRCNKDDPRTGLHLAVSPCGLNMPYIMLYGGKKKTGLILSECLNKSRPWFSLHRNVSTESASLRTNMFVYKVLWPGENHFLGEISIRLFRGEKYQAMKTFQQYIVKKQGISIPEDIPEGTENLVGCGLPIAPFDEMRKKLKELKDMGINCVYTAGQWHSGLYNSKIPYMQNPCVILPVNGLYTPEEKLGGVKAQKKFLNEAHRLGMKVICWITMSGISFEAQEVNEHPDWWIHDKEPWNTPGKWGDFSAEAQKRLEEVVKDRTINRDYGQICGGNPLSPGWRKFFIENLKSFHNFGYDGIFLDCLVHKSPDYASYPWYGECQDAEIDQMREIRHEMKKVAPDFLFVGETFGFQSQRYVDVCFDRHHPMRPSRPIRQDDSPEVKNTYWSARDFPKIDVSLIPEYFRISHLSKLPGARLVDYSIYYGSNLPKGTVPGDKEESFAWMFSCFCRDSMPLIFYFWKPYQSIEENKSQVTEQEKEFWKEVKRMISIRRKNRELNSGSMVFDGIHVGKSGVLAFARQYKSDVTLVLINFNSENVKTHARISKLSLLGLNVSSKYAVNDLLGGCKFSKKEWSGGELKKGMEVTIPRYRAVLLTIRKKT